MKLFSSSALVFSVLIFFILIAGFLAGGCAGTVETVEKEAIYNLPASKSLADSKVLRPGLSVIYYTGLKRETKHLDQLPLTSEGKPGKPITILNHQSGYGEVFDSGQNEWVGMKITGYIQFPEPGIYRFQAKTNDGFRLFLADRLIIEDPKYHADRYSDPGWVHVPEAGWYPLKILYFQGEMTSTLKLYWKKPGDDKRKIIPAEAYGHLPS